MNRLNLSIIYQEREMKTGRREAVRDMKAEHTLQVEADQ